MILGQHLAEIRNQRGLTQEVLAERAGISVATVRRLETSSTLPRRQRKDGNALDKVCDVVGLDVCDVLFQSFSAEELLGSPYARCVRSGSVGNLELAPHMGSLEDYIAALPDSPGAVLRHAGMMNAQAMAFLVRLERIFSGFEMLVTNQPPFVLFADRLYVTEGSSSTELAPVDRSTYHAMIFEHQREMMSLVRRNQKTYRVVLNYRPLVRFLSVRAYDRASAIVLAMQDLLRFVSFELVLIDDDSLEEEFEVLATTRTIEQAGLDQTVSLRHRRIGLDNTQMYQLAVIGMQSSLVMQDYRRAVAYWDGGIARARKLLNENPDLGVYRADMYPTSELTRVVASQLRQALADAHPEVGLGARPR